MRLFLGWDAAQMVACNVAMASARATTPGRVDVYRIALSALEWRGLYRRPTVYPGKGRPSYWDLISDAPMSTGHAIARFLVPALCDYKGWALFTDGDVLVRRDLTELFERADPQYAVQVVQHAHVPTATTKMDGQIQTAYARKNWSSVMLFNCGHPANRALTVDLVNTVPGRDLHRFCWLDDAQIGTLPPAWNWLVGHSAPDIDPAIVHFTDGLPNMAGYEHGPYADDWYAQARAAGYRLIRPEAEAVA